MIRRISAGTTTEIFLGLQSFGGAERRVAFKCLRPQLVTDPAALETFWSEARLSAHLQHPHIVQVLDIATIEDRPTIVLEHLTGLDLEVLLTAIARQHVALDPLAVAAIGIGVASALGFAHRQALGGKKILHREISPENLFLTRDGVVKVLDFGVPPTAARDPKARSARLKAKLGYVSPEQTQESTILDGRSDLFSLGAVLWELASGRRLFLRPTELQTVEALRNGHIDPPSRFSPRVPPGLDRAILHALSRDREERPATGEEMALELERILRATDSPSATVLVARTLDALAPPDAPSDEPVRDTEPASDEGQTNVDTTTVATMVKGLIRIRAGHDGEPAPGMKLGSYRLVTPIGRGGMGTVFEAVQEPIGRRVALKVIRRGIARHRTAGQRFVREAQIASSLSNPHTITIHDFGQTPDGILYLAMELLEGEDLSTRLTREGSIPPAEAARIAGAVCRSLSEAHRKGIVHRDIKTENVFLAVTDEGSTVVKVLDYGLARLSNEEQPQGRRLTGEGVLFGTPAYMSPEHIRGQEVGPGSDMYSVGILLFEMTTGVTPFPGADALSVMTAHISQAPPDPQKVGTRPELGPDLRALLASLLAKDPAARPDANEALQVLRKIGATPDRPVASEKAPVARTVEAAIRHQAQTRLLEPPTTHLQEPGRDEVTMPGPAVIRSSPMRRILTGVGVGVASGLVCALVFVGIPAPDPPPAPAAEAVAAPPPKSRALIPVPSSPRAPSQASPPAAQDERPDAGLGERSETNRSRGR